MDETVKDLGIATLVGAALPVLIAFIVQPGWSDAARSVVAFIICILGAIVAALFAPGVDIGGPSFDWVAWFGVVYGSAMVSYKNLYKPTGVAPKIEVATSPGGSKA